MGEFDILKYPRTRHLQGSRLQKGDEDLSQIPFSYIKDRHIVIEEKLQSQSWNISVSQSGSKGTGSKRRLSLAACASYYDSWMSKLDIQLNGAAQRNYGKSLLLISLLFTQWTRTSWKTVVR